MIRFIGARASVVIVIALLLASGSILLQVVRAQGPTAGDSVFNAEIAAVERDVAHAKSAEQRDAAEAKLQVLLDEKAARDAARRRRPATEQEDAAKMADLEASSRQAEAEASSYDPVFRRTGTGELVQGTPWDQPHGATFVSHVWWRSRQYSDGTRLAVWVGGFRGDSANGAILLRRYIDDGNGSIVQDKLTQVPGHGTLTITDEQEGVLILRGADGTSLAFDTNSLQLR